MTPRKYTIEALVTPQHPLLTALTALHPLLRRGPGRGLLLILAVIFLSTLTHAQSYKWVKGGGSTTTYSTSLSRSETVKYMCVDDNGNLYVAANMGTTNILADTFSRLAAHNYVGGNLHIFVSSYRCDGTMRWAKLVEGYGESEVGGIAYSNGNIYLTGKAPSDFLTSKYFGDDTTITNRNYASYLAKLDTGNNGDLKWIRFIGADVYGNQFMSNAGTVAIDGAGNIHNFARIERSCTVTPTYVTTQPGTYDLKYDVAGNLLSVGHVAALDSVWLASKIIYNKLSGKWFSVLEPNMNYWYSVYADYNSAVAAFKPDNTLAWIDTTGVNGGVTSIDYKGGEDIYVSAGGQMLTPGASFSIGGLIGTNTIGNSYGSLFKIDTNDNGKWVYNLMSATSIGVLNGVTILPGDLIASTGVFTGLSVHATDSITSTSGEGQNPLFLIVDSGGHTVKLDQMHGAGFYDWGTSICSDKIGNVYVGGLMQSNIWGGSLTPYVSNGGNTDYFVMKYGYNCSCTSVPTASYTSTATSASTFAFTFTGSAGYDSVRWQFGDGGTATTASPTHTYAAPGTYTACVRVFTPCGSNTYCSSIVVPTVGVPQLAAGSVSVCPNPATNELIITGHEHNATYRLMSITGATLQEGGLPSQRASIHLANQTPGMYVLEVIQDNGERSIARIVKE
ncbi:MAG: T9SS type A sorting domain-containing protein [Taibaiella sp.]|nr:T9SS type A sorting domain-containing protein [Taibaiella sp.]